MKSIWLIALLTACWLLGSGPTKGEEQFEQDTLSIMGNRGLPKTLYIVPWKLVGDPLEGGKFESGVAEDLGPIERDLFRRELEIHAEGYSVD